MSNRVIVDNYRVDEAITEIPSLFEALQPRQKLEIVDVISLGEIEAIDEVYYNDTSISHYQNIGCSYATGNANQPALAKNSSIDKINLINTRLEDDKGIVKEVDMQFCERLSLSLNIPNMHDYNNRDHNSRYNFALKIEIKREEQEQWHTLLNNKNYVGNVQNYTLQETFNLPEDYRVKNLLIRATKSSTRSTNQEQSNNEVYLVFVLGIIPISPTYPGTAYAFSELDSELFNGTPSRKFLVKGIKHQVPSNYDPVAKTYAGNWDGQFKIAYSNNPVWIIYDLLTHPVRGLGKKIDAKDVNKWDFYVASLYCDKKINNKSRHSFNLAINQHEGIKSLIAKITNSINGDLIIKNGKYCLNIDSPKPAKLIITDNEIIAGSLSYSSLGLQNRANVVKVNFINEEENFNDSTIRVADAGGIAAIGYEKELNLQAIGVTNPQEAHRFALYNLYTNQFETEMVSFGLGYLGAVLSVGDIIILNDSVKGTGIATRLDNKGLANIDETKQIMVAIKTDNQLVSITNTKSQLLTSQHKDSDVILFIDPSSARYFRITSIQFRDGQYICSGLRHFQEKFDLINNAQYAPELIQQAKEATTAAATLKFELAKATMTLTVEILPIIPAAIYKLRYRAEDGNWVEVSNAQSINTIILPDEGYYEFEASIHSSNLNYLGTILRARAKKLFEKEIPIPTGSTLINIRKNDSILAINEQPSGIRTIVKARGKIYELGRLRKVVLEAYPIREEVEIYNLNKYRTISQPANPLHIVSNLNYWYFSNALKYYQRGANGIIVHTQRGSGVEAPHLTYTIKVGNNQPIQMESTTYEIPINQLQDGDNEISIDVTIQVDNKETPKIVARITQHINKAKFFQILGFVGSAALNEAKTEIIFNLQPINDSKIGGFIISSGEEKFERWKREDNIYSVPASHFFNPESAVFRVLPLSEEMVERADIRTEYWRYEGLPQTITVGRVKNARAPITALAVVTFRADKGNSLDIWFKIVETAEEIRELTRYLIHDNKGREWKFTKHGGTFNRENTFTWWQDRQQNLGDSYTLQKTYLNGDVVTVDMFYQYRSSDSVPIQ